MKKIAKLLTATLIVLVMGAFTPHSVMGEDVYELKLTTDTVMGHLKTKAFFMFQKELEEKSQGRIKVKIFHSAQLYRDADAMRALGLGTVDMVCPVIALLVKVEPNADLTALPMFYARPPEVTRKLVDGLFGQRLNASLEKKMPVKIPGRWYELGYVALHTTNKKVTKLDDLQGLRIRYFGGKANSERLRAMGANPVMISWADLPPAVMRGTVDGLITSFQPLHSHKLVEAGITYSVKDKQYLMHYIPLVSEKFWNKLPTDLQKVFVEVWNNHVPEQRELARKMQDEGELAVEKLEKKKGGGIYRPTEEQLVRWRKQVMSVQDKLVTELKLDRELVNLAMEMLGMK